MEYSKISVLLLAKVEGTHINKKFFAENSIKVQHRLFFIDQSYSISLVSVVSPNIQRVMYNLIKFYYLPEGDFNKVNKYLMTFLIEFRICFEN